MIKESKLTRQMHLIKRSSIVFISLLLSLAANSQSNKKIFDANFFTQANANRTAAEWEPAVGTMIVYPLSIPYKLVVELAKDNHLYTIVENETSKNEALKWFTKWGINHGNNTFIYATQGVDAWWVRDWGPSAVFPPQGKMMLADGKYIYSTPLTAMGCADSLSFLYKDKTNSIIKTQTDDNAIIPVGKALKINVLDLPFINTGGNVLNDGLGTAFSTCIMLNENNYYNVSPESFLDLNRKLLGFTNYNIISNFEKSGIQHIDCFMKLLDEERILVAEPPADHELYSLYENIIESELKKLRTFYGRPYKILRIKTYRYTNQNLAAYTNSIIINKTVYVPLFNIKEDSIALKKWQEVMPGYSIKGFLFSLDEEDIVSKEMRNHYKNGYGWNFGDALHCRTRAVWDREMLFITVKTIADEVSVKDKNIVYTSIIDYSKKGLVKGEHKVFWRLFGERAWKTILLKKTGTQNHFSAEIPSHEAGKTIEYYVSAVSNSGRKETHPRTAPLGSHTFKIK